MLTGVATQKEVVFITYEDVIKDCRPEILRYIMKNKKDEFKDYLKVDILENLTDDQYIGLCLSSTSMNILEYLSKKDFNFDKTLEGIMQKDPLLYEKCKLLSIGESIHILLKQSFTQKIYIYTPQYDERIHHDIKKEYPDNKVEYISGPIEGVLNAIEERITTYILNDIELLKMMVDLKKVSYTNVLLANLGYNYALDEDDNLVLRYENLDIIADDNVFKVVTFMTTKKYDVVNNDK